ncbi:MAG TPA: type II secretion system protein [Acidobacteriaceae bacterium]
MERRTQPEVNVGEQGYLLLAMVLMVTLVLIGLAVAAPVVARDLQRDKEVESMHRQQEYVRALRLYYRKFKSYPPSMEALEKSNNVRYLRKQYIDPLTGKADWRIVHVGENQTTVKGFFGEPLGGISSTGAGGSGLGSASGMSSGIGGTGGTPGGTTTIGSTSALAGGFQGATVGTPGTPGTPGTTGPGGMTTAGGTGSGTGSSSSSGFGSGGVGQIMGVGTAKSGDSILTPNQQTTYDTWEFLYDPRIELMYAKSNILGGGGMGSQSASSMGSDAVNGIPGSSIPGSTTPGSTTPGSTTPGSTGPGSSFPGSSFPSSPTTPH